MLTNRQRLWIAEAGAVVAAAFFGGQGLAAVAETAVVERDGLLLAPPRGRLAAPPASRGVGRPSADRILSRNPFDSVTGSLLPSARAGEALASSAIVEPMSAPVCPGVRATIIASFADAADSLAAFEIDGQPAVLRRRGGRVGSREVLRIASDRVFLADPVRTCQAPLFGLPPASALAPGPGTAVTRGIQRVGPDDFRVDRSVVERVLEDPSEVMKGALLRPAREVGRAVGARLSGVRPDGLLGLLGLQDGDVLHRVNGFDLSSPEGALEAYARLRTATQLVVEFTRSGKEVSHRYDIE